MELEVFYTDSFKKIVKNCLANKMHLGGGNPNAKILLIGQEAALEYKEDWYNENAQEWNEKIETNLNKIKFSREEKFPPGHTWSKYQKLHNYIFPEFASNIVNFEERIFTTEMSDNPAKNNKEARRKHEFSDHLQKRKDNFFTEDFIQNFPVVVLACSGYIQNNDQNREIDNIFKVTYTGDLKGKFFYNKSNWFYLHYNEDKTRLVIHTRQLSTDVFDKMLNEMGGIIREHILSIS